MTSVWYTFLVFVYLSASSAVQGQSFKMEGLFLVDDQTVKLYMKDIPGTASDAIKRTQAMTELQKDITYTLNEINRLLYSFQPALYIELYVRALLILNVNVFPATSLLVGTQNGVSADVALTQFESYLQAQNYYNTYKYDFAFLWTGFDLYGQASSYTAGYAHVGKICDSKLATGVGEFTRTYQTAVTTAHEIGHILGSEHSGPASHNIMTPVSDPSDAKRWFFSNCSTSDIKDYIATLPVNCLLTTNASSTKPSLSYGSYTGQILNADVICQRSQNNLNSYMCKSWSLYNSSAPSGDKVCSQIYCALPGTQYCMSAFASDGMVCDSGKRCSNGKCLADSTAPTNITSNCAFGDQKVIQIKALNFNGTCIDFLSTQGSAYCYQRVISEQCCRSCSAYSTGRAGCEYGDKSTQCTKYSKAAICPLNKDTCCGFCSGFVVKRSVGLVPNRNANQILLPKVDRVFNETVVALHDHGRGRGSGKED